MTKEKNFQGYYAKGIGDSQGLRKTLKKFKSILKNDFLLLPKGLKEHKKLLEGCERVDDHTYTCFYRAPTQLSAIIGPVLEYLQTSKTSNKKIKILAFACSNGAEVYTLASWLRMKAPDLDFEITASDLHAEMLERGEAADYSADEVLHCEYVTQEFLDHTFNLVDGRYKVKPEIKDKITFTQANLLDIEELKSKFSSSDIVLAQNVLFHMRPEMAAVAFENAMSFLKPRGVFLVEGMDVNLREILTKKNHLRPLEWKTKEIYSETRIHTPPEWWKYYWGTEPYLPFRKSKYYRYGTIFLRG